MAFVAVVVALAVGAGVLSVVVFGLLAGSGQWAAVGELVAAAVVVDIVVDTVAAAVAEVVVVVELVALVAVVDIAEGSGVGHIGSGAGHIGFGAVDHNTAGDHNVPVADGTVGHPGPADIDAADHTDLNAHGHFSHTAAGLQV